MTAHEVPKLFKYGMQYFNHVLRLVDIYAYNSESSKNSTPVKKKKKVNRKNYVDGNIT